ncbi:Purple acid phosphatase [Rhynchospora pubera]|uniref:Purple acid phosphatase n=1 Tax=Rhynchospora pubera TaxID=906938 RepID=A0AAV8GTY8_9POAL|nr:Purple acid phosphatase [Rhynchospora pubera]
MVSREASSLLLLALSLSLLAPSLSSHVSLSVSPKTLTRSNRTVQIQWSGVESPSELDWLGIYSPPSSRDKNFIGYVFLNSSATCQSGYGSVELPLVNLRSNYVFRLFRWTYDEVSYRHQDHDGNPLPQTKHKLAVSEEIGFASGLGPEQIHLSFTDNEDEMRVMFITADGKENIVRYGLDEGALNQTAGTEVKRYEQAHMCDFPANSSIGWRDPGFIHDGVMKGLKNGKRYYYKIGSDATGWSATYSFISRDSQSNETFAFLFGDMGTYTPYRTFYRMQDESQSTVKWILRDLKALENKPALISHIGDISYARGFSWVWDEFFNQIEPIATSTPYHVCIGNHEYDWPNQPWRPWWAYSSYNKDGGGECGVPYSLKFHMPGDSSEPTGTPAPATRNLYYSFNAGVVHFIYISTETNFEQGSDQYKFIKSDLERVNRERTPFIVLQGHRPMYTTSNEVRDAGLREKMLQSFEPLLVQYKVTLALWGHVHRYERFCPVKNFQCVNVSSSFKYAGAPVHMVIGMGGQDWQPIWEPRPDHQDRPIFPQPIRSMYRGGEFGYTRLVATKEKLKIEYVGNHDGQVHDMVEIFSDLYVDNPIYDNDDNNNSTSNSTANTSFKEAKEVVVEPRVGNYVKAGSVIMAALLLGYVLGFFTKWKRENKQPTWTPVKTIEM